MIKRIFIAAFFIYSSFCAMAQKEDYTWLAGYLTQNYDTGFGKWIGECRFDFNQNPVTIGLDSMGISFGRSNSMISDADGNLLLSCNGVKVHNRFDEKIPGSDTLGNVDGGTLYFYLYPAAFEMGIPANQYHVFLPNPRTQGQYDIFHALIDTFEVVGGIINNGTRILRSSFDLNANFGHGVTIQKDVIVHTGENNFVLTATKHGNGRDWWLCTNQASGNCYTVMFYNGTENIVTSSYCGGGGSVRSEGVPISFSNDGSKFASAAISGLNVFDFDRCNGGLSLIEYISIPEFVDSFQWWPNAIKFSPNNRFLYLFSNFRIYQYDLLASPISSSQKIIANYDPQFSCPFPHTFYDAQLAPDGKIYINSGNTNYCLSVINNPDGEGNLCGFIRYGVDLPNFISGLPHFPNYRLGALPGSACDTLTSIKDIAEKEKLLKVFPNPAIDVATIDYGYTDWSKGEASMEIANSLGQVMHSQTLPMYSGFQKLDVSNYASGSYTVYVKRKGYIVATGRLVKE